MQRFLAQGNIGTYAVAQLLSNVFDKGRELNFIFRVVGNNEYLAPVQPRGGLFRKGNQCQQCHGVPALGVAEVYLLGCFFIDEAHALAEGIHNPCRALPVNVFLFNRKSVADDVVGTKEGCGCFFAFGFKAGIGGKIANFRHVFS